MTAKPTSIRRSLLRSLFILITLTAGTILFFTVLAGTRAVQTVSRALIDRAADRMEAELSQFFGAIEASTRIGRRWAEVGLLDPTDVTALNALFVPILEHNPQFSSMMVATSEGTEYMLLRDPLDPDLWTNRIVQADRVGEPVLYQRWNRKTLEVEESRGQLDYDPRLRLWYRAALETTDAEPIAWTAPAIFFTTKDPGLTAATHVVLDGDAGQTIVVAFDVLLLDISLFTTSVDVSENGIAFILSEAPETADFRVIGLPSDPGLPDEDSIREALLFLPPDQAVADDAPELPPVHAFASRLTPAFEAWQAAGRPEQALRFGTGINAWWTGFRRFPLGDNVFWIGVAVPTTDLLGDVVRRSQVIAGVGTCALLLAIFMASRLARSYGAPLEELARSSRRIGDLNLEEPVAIDSRLSEVDQLAREQEHMRITLDAFARYVPVDLVRRLLNRGEAAKIGGTRQYLTILFTDIEGFTGVSEVTSPEKLTAHLEEYFEALLEVIRAHRGEVNQLLGDGVVAFWGAPLPDPEHAQHAVEAILVCRDRLIELNASWEERGMPRLPTRFGVATGEVVVGNVGSHSRLAYAAVGDPVNLASRIEGLNRFYGTHLLVSSVTQAAAGESFEWRHVDGVRAKGKTLPVELHEPLGRVGEVPAEVLAFRDAYENALEAYRERNFAAAITLLDAIPEPFRGHLSVTRLQNLAHELEAQPPPEDWDAITTFTEK